MYKNYQFMSSVYSAENPADGSSVFVPTC